MTLVKLSGHYKIEITGDTSALRVGYDTKHIGYLMERLLTGEEVDLDLNLAPSGIRVRVVEGGGP